MREHKYRAWVQEEAREIQIRPVRAPYMTKPFSFKDFDEDYFLPEGCYLEDMTIMDYSGLKDNNDKKIYEEDILPVQKAKGGIEYHKVWFDRGTYCCGGWSLCELLIWQNPVVEGNAYENPELINKEV